MAEPTKPPPQGADDFDTRLAERMAAQIDGALPDGVSFLDGLADDDLAVFAEAAAIERELEEEDRAAGVLPLHGRSRSAGSTPAWRDVRVLAIAAVVATLALGTGTWTAGGRAVRGPSQAVALLERRDYPAEYEGDRRLTQRRGQGSDGLSQAQRSAQVGVYLVDLELAIRGGQAGERRRLAQTVRELMDDYPGPAGSGFAALAASTETDVDALLAGLRSARDAATEFLDADRVALGAWSEAARLAARDRDADFFRGRRTGGTLKRAEARLADDPAALAALAGIRAAKGGDAPDWDRLRRAVDALQEAIA